MVCTPLSDENLRLAAQIGVTDIVGRYPGNEFEDLQRMDDQVAKFGMKLSVIEGYLPMDRIRLGQPGREEDMETMIKFVRNMGKLDVPVLCYHFVGRDDWTRTSWNVEDRGGALVSEFNLDDFDAPDDEGAPTTDDHAWVGLEYFLNVILPVAEDAGVKLAMHPADPPISPLYGLSRVFCDVPAFDRLCEMSDSPSNGICFCGGCFSEMGVDVPATIRRFGDRITFAHFRDVVGVVPKFQETFHDKGQTDMAEAMRAYKDIGYTGLMRPDHVPRLEGEQGEGTGYSMMGRLFAVGYMRGLMHALGVK
jgi:mannonate dehydratase